MILLAVKEQEELGHTFCNEKLLLMKNARRRSGIFIVNFEHISHLLLVFLLSTLNM